MVFDLYFNISRTSIELLALGLIIGGAVYVIKDLVDEKEKEENDSIPYPVI